MSLYDQFKSGTGVFEKKTPAPVQEAPKKKGFFGMIGDLFTGGGNKAQEPAPTPQPAPPAQSPEKPAGSLYEQYKAKTGVFAQKSLSDQFDSKSGLFSGDSQSPPLPDASLNRGGVEKSDTLISRGVDFIKGITEKAKENPAYRTAANFFLGRIPGIGMGLQLDKATKPIQDFAEEKILDFMNTPQGKETAQYISEATSNLPLKAFSIINSIGRGEFEKRYENYQNLIKEAEDDASKNPAKKLALSIQNTAPQTAIGVLLSLGTTALTKSPHVGRTIGGLYWTALSADEQIRERGKVESLGNIAIDVIGDQILGEMIGRILREPATVISKSFIDLLKKQGVQFARGGGIEGGTEVAQTLIKYANDFRNAEDQDERNSIIEKVKQYILSGDILQEFGSAFISGGLIAGGASLSQGGPATMQQSGGDILNVETPTQEAPVKEPDEQKPAEVTPAEQQTPEIQQEQTQVKNTANLEKLAQESNTVDEFTRKIGISSDEDNNTVLFHGTQKGVELKEAIKNEAVFGSKEGLMGQGFYAAPTAEIAEYFGKQVSQDGTGSNRITTNTTPEVLAINASLLNMKNLPYGKGEYYDFLEKLYPGKDLYGKGGAIETYNEKLRREGYDGLNLQGRGEAVIWNTKKIREFDTQKFFNESRKDETLAKQPVELKLNIQGKAGPFYQANTLDYGTLAALHGKRFADAVESGDLVNVYRAGKQGETLKSGTFLTANKSVAKGYLNQKSTKEGEFGGPELYSYKVNARDLVSVDNLDYSELIYKPSKEMIKSQKVSPETIAEAEDLLSKEYAKNPEAQNELNTIYQEMDLAEAGSRIFIEQPETMDAKVVGVESTFPKWLPEHLRSKDLFKKVMGGILDVSNIHYPEGQRSKQRALYNDILNELDRRIGIDTSGLRNAIMDAYENGDENALKKAIQRGPIGGTENTGGELNLPEWAQPIKKESEAESATLGFKPKNLEKPQSAKASEEIDRIVKRSEIVKELEKKLNVPIRRGKFRDKALGIYKPGQAVIRFKEGYLKTIFHEVGHFIDYRIENFSNKITAEERGGLLQEYNVTSSTPVKKEAFAEFLRYYMTQPERAFKIAPKFHTYFETRLNAMPELKDTIDKAKNDFLRWENMPSVAKVVSQISYKPEIEGSGILDTLASKYHQLYENVMDDLHPLDEYVKLAEKKSGGPIPVNENPYALARLLRGWVSKAETFLEKGTFDRVFWNINEKGVAEPRFTGKSFKEIVAPIQEKGGLEDLSTYLIARRAIDLAKRKTDDGKGIKTGINPNDARQAIKELEEKYSNIEKVAKELYEYQDKVLEYGRQSGLYDAQFLGKIRAMNPNYVPFYRVVEELQSRGYMGKGIGNVSKEIKRIKGSDRDIINPLESIVRNTFAIINASERNSVAMALMNLSKIDPELGRMFEPVPVQRSKVASVKVADIMDAAIPPQVVRMMGGQKISDTMPPEIAEQMINIFRPSMINKGNVISVLVNGKARYFEVDPALYRSLQGLGQEDVALVWRLLSYPAKFLRAGATLSPDFMIRNPARDQVTAFVYSKYGFLPGIDLARGVFSLFKKTNEYWLWRMGGGEHAALVSLDRDYLNKKTFEEVLASKSKKAVNYVKNPLRLLQALSEFGEQGTRLGEARKALKKGANPLEASFAAREITLDFARIGSKTKAVNMIIAFWNAQVQGMDKMVRSFKERPVQTTLRTMIGITLPSIILYFVNRDDPRWKEIPQWQKDLFWIVMTKDHIYRIPKPFELGIIFGSLPERILEYIDTKDPAGLESVKESIFNGAMPGFIPSFMLPWLENAANYSFFLDRSLVSPSKEDLPPEAQYNEYTHEFSKIMGKWLNYSPIKIDNVLRAYFAGLGSYVFSGVDAVLNETGISNPVEKPSKRLEDLPVIKSFSISEPIGYNSESVSKFYEAADRAQAGYTHYKDLMENGRRDEAMQYMADHPDLKLAPYYSSIREQLSQISQAKDRVLKSASLSPDEKRKKIDELDRIMTHAASRAVEMLLKQ